MYYDLKYLEVGLPEDILKLKWAGHFDQALRLIDDRLHRKIPFALRQRLLIESDIIRRISATYTFSFDEALNLLRNELTDFNSDEFKSLIASGDVDWIFINGEPYFRDNILENLIKTESINPKRAKYSTQAVKNECASKELKKTILEMKQNGNIGYKFCIKASIKPSMQALEIGEIAKVHLPIPIEYSQVKNVKILETSTTPKYISNFNSLTGTIYFEEKLNAYSEFYVVYEFETHMRYNHPQIKDVAARQPHFYTEECPPHIRFTKPLKALLSEIIGGETNALVQARLIYDYITCNVKYSYMRQYFTITDIVEYLTTGWKGDCGIQAVLFIALCRAAGIPARWQSGLFCNPKKDIGSHDWAEFYVAPFGWLYADCSFGGAAHRCGDLEKHNFYFGNLDPFRVPTTREYQAELFPIKNFMRDDPYDNQHGEIEYAARGLCDNELVHHAEILNCKRLY